LPNEVSAAQNQAQIIRPGAWRRFRYAEDLSPWKDEGSEGGLDMDCNDPDVVMQEEGGDVSEDANGFGMDE
jgi:hypothetical protein